MRPYDHEDEGKRGAAATRARLADRSIPHEILEHRPTYRAADEARSLDAAEGVLAKTVVAIDHDRYWLAVVPASRTVDLARLRRFTGGSRHLRLATEEEIGAAFAEFEVGATPPLGALIGVGQVIDPLVLAHDPVTCAGGDHQHSLRLSPDALIEAAQPTVADIASHTADDHRARFADTPYG